jgi:hypothetical protein
VDRLSRSIDSAAITSLAGNFDSSTENSALSLSSFNIYFSVVDKSARVLKLMVVFQDFIKSKFSADKLVMTCGVMYVPKLGFLFNVLKILI